MLISASFTSALLASQIFLGVPLPSLNPAATRPCPEAEFFLNKDSANQTNDECPTFSDGRNIFQVLRPEQRTPLDRQRDTQQYQIIYSDQCRPGLEFIGSCLQNPDEQLCLDGSQPYWRIILFSGGPRNGDLQNINRFCSGDPEPAPDVPPEQIIQDIRITPAQFRSFPILPSELGSDPEQYSLRNGHSHFWATADTQTFETTVSGTAVEIRAIPIQWLWNYGDGTTRNLNHPGEPAPNHTLHHETPTSHSYTETGIFQVNLTTLYRGEFRIVGEGWQSIPGQAAVPSDAVPIDVWRTEKELVAPDGQ